MKTESAICELSFSNKKHIFYFFQTGTTISPFIVDLGGDKNPNVPPGKTFFYFFLIKYEIA
jgi:hypothetical protein